MIQMGSWLLENLEDWNRPRHKKYASCSAPPVIVTILGIERESADGISQLFRWVFVEFPDVFLSV